MQCGYYNGPELSQRLRKCIIFAAIKLKSAIGVQLMEMKHTDEQYVVDA